MNALIGHTGFVGTTLSRQRSFDEYYRSVNIHEIRGKSFDLVVCAGAPAQKWMANRDPKDDLAKISSLIDHLDTITCKKFVLISSVDVFKEPQGVDEVSQVDVTGLHPYGLHRRMLEQFVDQKFAGSLIVRLPGLVGPGLRKNVLYDFCHNNNLQSIDSRNSFQFYPMVSLWFDIGVAIRSNLDLIHLTAEPITVSTMANQAFGRTFSQVLDGDLVTYDMRTIHADLFGTSGVYQYTARDSILATRAYFQSEMALTSQGAKN